MKKKSLLLIGFMSMALFVSAQTADSKVAIGLYGGKNEYVGDLGNGILDFNQTGYWFGGASLSAYLSRSFDIGIQGNYGDYGYLITAGPRNNFWGRKFEGTLFGHYKLNNGYLFNENSKLSPFLELGVGMAGYKVGTKQSPRINADGYDFLVPVGGGLKYQFNRTIALQYKFIYNFTNQDKRDNIIARNNNDAFVEHSLGIIFSFGGAKDTDGDGVPDKIDKCPDTPKGVQVDALGCPIDTDGDGVPDYLDKCPDTPKGAAVDANGCPLDTDGDGVPDYLDKCPDTPKGVTVDASGCPFDADGDGVPDYLDQCPNTPAGVAVDAKGCPLDSDGDGVPDNLDKCPDTPKGVAVDANGCPLDRDGDGVPDYLDKCPDVPGTVANKGCPEVKAEAKKIFAQALKGVQFESGKDIITKASYPILNKVVNVLKENKEYNLAINGHTDNKGDKAKNMVLSQKRAEAVKKYLESKGIDPQRLTAQGFGETMPVADNSTAAGRAQNRRVEFKVNF
ncbi:MAG: thrombospondin type 3 repeat-containing protein [Bacteroidota bacterium]|nr:thrombospondin type 3 repeat-containing protein [Bacteroidota bacterium]